MEDAEDFPCWFESSSPDRLLGPSCSYILLRLDRTLDLLCLQRSSHSVVQSPALGPTLMARQIGESFSMQHDKQLGATVWDIVRRNWDLWSMRAGPEVKKRGARSLSAGGASGTGKTRFGSELPHLLHSVAVVNASAPSELLDALSACCTHNLVLRFAFGRSVSVISSADNGDLYAAEVLWAAYMDSCFGGVRVDPPGRTTTEIYNAISRIERQIEPRPREAIMVVVHLDEVQNCFLAPERLGVLVSNLLAPFTTADRPSHGIFPLVYLSGVNKLQFKPTPSTEGLVSLSLPLLTADHYAAILRDLFKWRPDWRPRPPLMRALRSIEGPPRLLELLLWAVQSTADVLDEPLITAPVHLQEAEERLLQMTWEGSVPVLYRAISSLHRAGLIVHQESLAGRTLGPVVRCVMGHVLLGSDLPLEEVLVSEPRTTVNDVIFHGVAQSTTVSTAPVRVRLHWPRLYLWAVYKVSVWPTFLSLSLSLLLTWNTVARGLGSASCNSTGHVARSPASKGPRRGAAAERTGGHRAPLSPALHGRPAGAGGRSPPRRWCNGCDLHAR